MVAAETEDRPCSIQTSHHKPRRHSDHRSYMRQPFTKAVHTTTKCSKMRFGLLGDFEVRPRKTAGGCEMAAAEQPDIISMDLE